MLDIRRIRKKSRRSKKKALNKRHGDFPIDEVLELDEKKEGVC